MNITQFLINNPVLIVVIVVAILILGLVISRLLSAGDAEWKIKAKQKAEQGLGQARKLHGDGYYEQALNQAFTTLEGTMKAVLRNPGVSAFEAIQTLHKRGKLSDAAVAKVHFIRKLRNSSIHQQQSVSAATAASALSDTKRVLDILLD